MSEGGKAAPPIPVQDCPQCGLPMQATAGLKTAICGNCGYKEPCC